jgi:glycosyltransferase involved in cell wall biosynthesis
MYTSQRKSISGRIAAFVGVSDFVRDAHLSCGFFGAAGLTTVIHNAQPAPRQMPPASARPAGPLRLGFLGRLEAAKGIEGLLAALRPMAGDFTLRIGGAGNAAYMDRLKAQYADDRFIWLGRVESEGFLDGIDALVVPSIWNEPFGLVVGEAHSRGVPVVGARRGGIPEIIRHGRDGFLYEPDRPDELADIVKRLLADRSLVAAMSEEIAARQPALGIDEWTAVYSGLYRSVKRRAAQPLAAE